MADVFPISGSIDPDAFPYLLGDLHRQGATGSLKVDGPSAQKALYFRGGRILFGSSNDPRDQLGAILIESGRLTAEQLDEASAKVGPGSPLAKVLADSGLVSQRELSEAARAKVERILCDLFGLGAGSFEFEDDVLPKGAIDLKLATPRLFVAALRRVEAPGFVERHLGGLDVVLRPRAASGERLSEVFGEVRGLPDVLDGRRTLREAAALAQIDAAEVGRLACALLFLGLVEKTSDSAPAFEAIESEADEMDLTGTARITFDFAPDTHAEPPGASQPASDTGDTPFFLSSEPVAPPPAAEPVFRIDPSVFAPAPEPQPAPEPEPEPTVRVPPPEVGAATLRVPPPAPEPPAPPTLTPRPAPARASGSNLPLVPPPPRAPRRPPAARADEPEPTLEPPPSPRPSKEDLEALDTLLNARGLDAPLGAAPPGRAPGVPPRRAPAWEPSFGRDAPARGRVPAGRARGGAGRGGVRPGWIVLAALLLLAVGGGGWYWLGQAPAKAPVGIGVVKPRTLPGGTAAPAALPSPIAVGTAPPQAVPPSSEADDEPPPPKRVPDAVRAVTPPLATVATPPPPRATPAPPGRAASTDDARAALQRGDLATAGRGFVGTLRAAPRETYSLQLLLACAPDTVTKAVASATAPELFIVPIHYRGRDCYRVCWGLYDSRARAESASRSVPPYFRAGGARPKVVAAAELLP